MPYLAEMWMWLICLEVDAGVYLTMDCDVYGLLAGKDIGAFAGF